MNPIDDPRLRRYGMRVAKQNVFTRRACSHEIFTR